MTRSNDSKIVISDLDGTIALIEHRRHWLDRNLHSDLTMDDRWQRFFSQCTEDLPHLPVIRTLQALKDAGYQIHIFSGRSDVVKVETIKWLKDFNVPYNRIRMREEDDRTPDEVLKRSWLKEYDLSNILCIFDDRQKVVNMWRENGLTCFQVAPGDF